MPNHTRPRRLIHRTGWMPNGLITILYEPLAVFEARWQARPKVSRFGAIRPRPKKIGFFGGLIIIQTYFDFWDSCLLQSEHFWGKFCPYIRATFLQIFIRPCHLYSGVPVVVDYKFFLPKYSKHQKNMRCTYRSEQSWNFQSVFMYYRNKLCHIENHVVTASSSSQESLAVNWQPFTIICD